MRKTTYYLLSLFLLMLGAFYACRQDEGLDEETDGDEYMEALSAAQVFYDGFVRHSLSMRSAVGEEGMPVKPVWESSFMQTKGKMTAVEVALCPEFGFNYILPECVTKYQATGDKRYRTSCTRFVFLTDDESGYTQMFLMTIVPRASYMESTRFRPFRKMAYLKRDKDFSGLIFFHHADGTFANGWVYDEGKIISPMSFVSESDPEYVLTRNTCMTSITYLVTTCGSWSTQAGEHEFTGSECTSEVVTEYYYTTCGDGGSSGSTGGMGGYYDEGGYNSQIETRDPCTTRSALSASTSLNNKIDNLSSRVCLSTSAVEDGWIRTSSGEYIYPKSATTGNMTYSSSDVQGKTFTENIHAHPMGGSMYPSFVDLVALSTWYDRGHINAGNYIYGVVSEFGTMVLTIAHEPTFRMFTKDVLNGEQGMAKREFKDFYDLAGGSVENIVCQFIQFLNKSESGLQVLYKPNESFGKPEWSGQWKVLDMGSSSSLNSNCNQ